MNRVLLFLLLAICIEASDVLTNPERQIAFCYAVVGARAQPGNSNPVYDNGWKAPLNIAVEYVLSSKKFTFRSGFESFYTNLQMIGLLGVPFEGEGRVLNFQLTYHSLEFGSYYELLHRKGIYQIDLGLKIASLLEIESDFDQRLMRKNELSVIPSFCGDITICLSEKVDASFSAWASLMVYRHAQHHILHSSIANEYNVTPGIDFPYIGGQGSLRAKATRRTDLIISYKLQFQKYVYSTYTSRSAFESFSVGVLFKL